MYYQYELAHFKGNMGHDATSDDRPGYRQGDIQQNDDAKFTHFAGRFDGHPVAAVRYRVHRLMEEVQGFRKSH
jgi:hypothetical protein